jgi:Fungal specific transcription factor domain
LVSTKKTTSLDVVDLKLMHYFITVVSYDLSNPTDPEYLALWQVHAVKLGFKHDFLLRGILAVAAYHMGDHRPERKAELELVASTHQNLALTSFQEMLADVNESNCHALFAFSCLIIVMAFASNSKAKPSDFNTEVLQWFYLLRGASIVLHMHSDSIKCSFLKPMLDEMAHTDTTAAHTIPDADRITDLFRICGVSSHDRETSQAYNLAISSLLNTFKQTSICKSRGQGTILAGFVWPITIPPKFVDLLSEKQPEALLILAYYCVIVHWGQEGDQPAWFLIGWGRYMLETVQDLLPESWHEHLDWPYEMTRPRPDPQSQAETRGCMLVSD